METGISYQNYISARKNLQTSQGSENYQALYAQNFEAIYAEALHYDIKLSNAKDFLETLSSTEIKTLQKYSGLAEAIDVGSLSEEGAYNLFMHDYEQYDFNSDGIAEVGKAKMILPIPITMPSDVRDAYITAMNSLNDKERLMVSSLSFDVNHLKSVIYNTPYTPSIIDYAYLSKNVEQALNPTREAYSSDEFKTAVRNFWALFESVYQGSRELKNQEQEYERDPQIEKFLKDLREKGALQFLADFNQEKIDAKVEKFKNKLLVKLGDSPEALAEIEKLVENFKKQLLEELEASLDSDDESSIINKQAIIQTMLQLKNDKSSNLENLLKERDA